MDAAEQRKFPRFHYSIPIKYREKGRTIPTYTVTRDISVGGLKILTSDFLPRGTEINVEVELPHLSLVNASASVAWSNRISHSDSYLCGLTFSEMGNAEKENISDLVSYALKS